MAIEIVDLPINSMVIFHSYVCLPGRVNKPTIYYHDLSRSHDYPMKVDARIRDRSGKSYPMKSCKLSTIGR